jgi:hypothetical protein
MWYACGLEELRLGNQGSGWHVISILLQAPCNHNVISNLGVVKLFGQSVEVHKFLFITAECFLVMPRTAITASTVYGTLE